MAILDYLFPTFSVDVVAVYVEDTYTPIFQDARAIKASIKEDSQVMTHPVEDGTVIADHKVISPTEIELVCIMSSELYRITYEAIKLAFRESSLMTVQTRTGVYNSMVIASMPHTEDADMHNAVAISIKLVEVKTVAYTEGEAPTVGNPESSKNITTNDVGNKKATDITASAPAEAQQKESVLHSWIS